MSSFQNQSWIALGGIGWALAVAACGGVSSGGDGPQHAEPPQASSPPLPWESAEVAPPEIASDLVAIQGGVVMTAAGDIYEDGTVVMHNGRIVAVGATEDIELPDGVRLINAEGRYVTPGIIDTHSHMGVYAVPHVRATSDGNEATSPVTAGVWAGDSFWPQDPALPRAIAGGVTTIQVLPGSANLIGGRGVTLKMHLGRSLSEMLFPGAPITVKMACGENPKRVYGSRHSAPSTRMGNVLGYRNAFQSAREYGRAWSNWQHTHRVWQGRQQEFEAAQGQGGDTEDDPDDPGPAPAPPDRNFDHETLLAVIEGRALVQMHCYRADEMARMIEVGEEFGFSVRSFHHAIEAYKIRDLLAAGDVGVSTWADWWGFKLEAYDAIQENLSLLTEAGVRGVLHSDSNMLIQRLNQEVAKALAAGRRSGVEVSDDQALRWITANAAWTLGIADQTGTLEVGKMADVVVWSGSPFSVYTRADLVYIDGRLAFDRREGPQAGTTDFEVGQDIGEAP